MDLVNYSSNYICDGYRSEGKPREIMAITAEVLQQAKDWVAWDPCAETRSQVETWISAQNAESLHAAFGSRIQFGTAGLRAEMGPGISRMNYLIILQTSQGLCEYLLKILGATTARERGIAIGYDHRERGALNSRGFAHLCARVFLSKGFKVYLFSDIVATPFIPFCVDKHGCAAGVMVTASHNPKADNGFKVYWGNGSQIIPPHDSGIAQSILENLQPVQAFPETPSIYADFPSLCVDPLMEVQEEYFRTIANRLCRFHLQNQADARVKITYTAMHGVGHAYTKQAFEAFNLPEYVPVKDQIVPDPVFPTVKFPNPEEGEGALKLAFETAESCGSTLILANDPDADRLAVAELQPDGEWRIFTGNEIGALLAHWQFTQERSANSEEQLAMVASTVSSKLIGAMAAKEGFRFEETLTGFKWIGNKAIELRKAGYKVIFAFEEAIGFCVGNIVNDKDGVCAAAVFAEMANELKRQSKSCADHLEQVIYGNYGHFVTLNHYIVSPEASVNAKIFERLRNRGNYWFACGNGKYRITAVRDLLAPGYDSSKDNKKPDLPVSASSQMITFTFANGCVATLRMSGTEPKLKYYTELSGPSIAEAEKELSALVEQAIKGDMLKSSE